MASFTAMQLAASNRVRREWQGFLKTHSAGRAALEHKVEALKAKADTEYSRTATQSRIPQIAHDATKARLVKDLRERYFEGLRSQWQAKLLKAGLKDEQWVDISDGELTQVLHLLGSENESDEDMVYVAPPTKSVPLTQPSLFYTPSPAVAPSISTSTRVSNASSASSYAFVNPSEFHSEEEDYFFNPHMTSSHEVTSDEDEGAASSTSHPTRRRVDPFGSWSDSESNMASIHNSIHSGYESSSAARPLASDFTYNSRSTSSARQAALAKERSKEKEKEKEREKEQANAVTPGGASGSKNNADRAPYIGPSVDDPEDSLTDEEDFERFKMQTRFQKITEYHQAAALAEIQLSIKIYRSRKAGEKHVVSGLLAEHQKSMSQLQATKEDERKALVDKERTRRRSELRRRPGRSNTILAPMPSAPTNPIWLHNLEDNAPEEVQTKFDIDMLLSGDPNNQNVDALLQQMLTEASSKRPALGRGAGSMPGHNSAHSYSGTGSEFQAAAMQATAALFEPKPQRPRATASSSAAARGAHPPQQNSTTSFSASASHSYLHKRRESDADRHKAPGRASAKPSPFGEDESSSDEEEQAQKPVAPPPSRGNQQRTNPFANPHMASRVADELQNDPEIAVAFQQYAGIATPAQTPGAMPSWGSRLATETPSIPGGWVSKETTASRATPAVVSGWTKRKAGTATPQPQMASDSFSGYNSSATIPTRNQFGFGDERANGSAFGSNNVGSMSAIAKGKKSMLASEEQGSVRERAAAAKAAQEQEQQDSLWEKHVGKTSSSEVPQAARGRNSAIPQQQESDVAWGNHSSIFASEDRQPMWGKRPTPPTEEAHTGWGIKSMTNDDRQTVSTWSNKAINQTEEIDPMQAAWSSFTKPAGNSAGAAASKAGPKAPPVPANVEKVVPSPPATTLAKKQAKKQRLNKKGGAVEEPDADPEPITETPAAIEDQETLSGMESSVFDTPESMFSSTVTSIGRMIPGVGRNRMDSFGAWESETASTPRQASKIPAHLMQDSTTSFKAEAALGAARTSLHKKTESMVSTSPLSQGTVKASMWGSAATSSSTQRGPSLWNMWGGGESKNAQQDVKEPSPERDPWGTGGFEGNEQEGGENEAEEQQGGVGGWDDSANDAGGNDAFWTPAAAGKKPTSATPSMSTAQRMRLGLEGSAVAPKPAIAPKAVTPVPVAVIGGKKGKKGKNAIEKKAFVEEVPDEEETTRGGSLPVDSRSILEDSQPILEPKPSVPSKLFDSIISYTNVEDEGGASRAAGSSTPANAMSEAPEPETAQASAWGASLNTKKPAEPEPKAKTPPPAPAAPAKVTGQAGAGKKGKKGRK